MTHRYISFVAIIIVFTLCSLPCLSYVQQAKQTTNNDTLFLQVVDCAMPPLAFSSMASAFSTDDLIAGFIGLAPGEMATALMKSAMERVKKDVNPERMLKVRLARYFSSMFTEQEARTIVTSCTSEAGFTDKSVFDKFQDVVNDLGGIAQKEAVMLTMELLGRFLQESAKELSNLSPTQLGFTEK